MMKNPIMLVACTLLFASFAALASQSSFSPDKCCFEFSSKRLPKHNVVSFKYTDNLCPMPGVIFKMKKGNEICVDPSVQWAKNIIKTKEDVNAEKVNNSESEKSF